MLIPENDIPEHGVIVRLLPPLPQLVKAAAGPVLWRGGEENLYIRAGEDTRTSLPLVYAAGDIRTKPLRQVVCAAADGAVAASMAALDLGA